MAIDFIVDDDAEKLAVLERVIAGARSCNPAVFVVKPGDIDALKAICSDIRARSPAAANKALEAIGFQVDSAIKCKRHLGYIEVGHAQALADRVLAHWVVLRLALTTLPKNITENITEAADDVSSS